MKEDKVEGRKMGKKKKSRKEGKEGMEGRAGQRWEGRMERKGRNE